MPNDYCRHVLPLMLSLRYQPVALLTFWSLTHEERTSLRMPTLPLGRSTKEFPYLFHRGVTDTPKAKHGRGERAGERAGEREALAYCEREAAFLAAHNASGTKEANAYFVRDDTPLPPPPVAKGDEHWPFERAEMVNGKLKLS